MDIKAANHRRDFETCPHCGKQYKSERWRKHRKSFSTQIHFRKHTSGVVVSECQRCEGLSWVHVNLDSVTQYSGYLKRWEIRAEKELAKRRLQALRDWEAGLCGGCAKLESEKVTTGTWRECHIGFGPVQTECSDFIAKIIQIDRTLLANWLKSEWGATLERCGGSHALGRAVGSWKTGWQVGVALPGCGYTWYRYRSLREVATRFEFERAK